MAFDASPSWSGFNYQGKVAIYYTLKLINMESVDQDLSNYSLMLEATEDFEIRKDGNPISFHQVKAYNSSSYSEYSEALLGITLELSKHKSVYGKIHTWKVINSKPKCKDLTESIKSDLSSLLDEYKNSNPKSGSSILEKATSNKTGLPKVAAILKSALKSNTAEQLYKTLESIKEGGNNALTRLKPYQYDDGNEFCDLDEINLKIKSEISSALTARSAPVTPQRLEKTFYYLLGMMDQYIINRHKTKQIHEKISITFNEVVEALECDHEDVGSEYLAYKFKEKFTHLIDEYMSDPDDYEKPNDDSRCNLKELSKFILGLSPIELWAHYRNFSPQLYLEHSNNTENALDADLSGVRHVLIKIFHKINFERASHDFPRYKLTYLTSAPPHRHYLPTTINHIARSAQIEKAITKNPNMSEILFEIENLIYNGEEPHSFSPMLLTHTDAPIAIDADQRSKRDEILSRINLVPISVAKDVLI